MDDLGVYQLFNSISVVSGRLKGGHERLCAMKHCLGSGRFSPPAGFEPAIPKSEFSRQPNKSCQKVYLHVTFLKLISVAFFSIYSSAGYGLCTLTARRRIVLAPSSQALSIFRKSQS